ncbi:MAG: serine/threonine protein kinase/CheY-like chemotaxis protein [Bradymonadia bacterium]|jgi:serine/threonine protein kinase/CheY-like chemotaxis protein
MSSDFASGTVIAGRFTLHGILGEGGMGAVYRATQDALLRPVAIKLLLPHLVKDELARARFEREARVASLLRHKHAVEIYDFGETDGSLYLAMQLLHGQSLRDLLRRNSGQIALERVLNIIAQVADALVAAHRMALIHRDIKPENIFLEREEDETDRAVVVDFGLAFIADSDDMGRLTKQGALYGSPAYMSPEQAREPEVAAPTDIYSLGCVLHELVTGQVPFDGGGIQVLSKHCFSLLESPRERFPELDIPPALDSLILRMLRKRPEGRPSAEDVRRTVVALRADERGNTERDSSRQLGRAARMVPRVPTEVVDRLASRPAPRGILIAVIGTLDEDIVNGLRANGFDVVKEPALAQIILAVGQSKAGVARLVGDAPVIADAVPTDMDQIAALLRAGVREVVPAPIQIEELVRRLRRIARRLDR